MLASLCLLLFFPDITIGFDKKNYSVNECDGIVSITIAVESSVLQREVAVYLSTMDQTAFGEITVSLISRLLESLI